MNDVICYYSRKPHHFACLSLLGIDGNVTQGSVP